MFKMHVIVVGCGLGGLATAIGCRHEGLEVTVLEQSAELAEVGHFKLYMFPNNADQRRSALAFNYLQMLPE